MSHYSSMEEEHQEMQLFSTIPHHAAASSSYPPPSWGPTDSYRSLIDHFESPSLDLKLSISVSPVLKPPSDNNGVLLRSKVRESYNDHMKIDSSCVEALKWQAAEQIRLASMEKSYAERLRELTRREMELAQAEFARARNIWERTREEVERVEKMKDRATRKIDSTCMEITCQSCRIKFRP
ncbi:uncharacterized protein [Primulina huaijiensis]|uniref:uncharacterized protein n=1 Tax=Primulina huaijiensis TaxID=1492673 RepID=UPI003CC71B84